MSETAENHKNSTEKKCLSRTNPSGRVKLVIRFAIALVLTVGTYEFVHRRNNKLSLNEIAESTEFVDTKRVEEQIPPGYEAKLAFLERANLEIEDERSVAASILWTMGLRIDWDREEEPDPRENLPQEKREIIRRFLDSSHDEIRLFAAIAAAQIGLEDPRVVPILQEAMDSKEDEIKHGPLEMAPAALQRWVEKRNWKLADRLFDIQIPPHDLTMKMYKRVAEAGLETAIRRNPHSNEVFEILFQQVQKGDGGVAIALLEIYDTLPPERLSALMEVINASPDLQLTAREELKIMGTRAERLENYQKYMESLMGQPMPNETTLDALEYNMMLGERDRVREIARALFLNVTERQLIHMNTLLQQFGDLTLLHEFGMICAQKKGYLHLAVRCFIATKDEAMLLKLAERDIDTDPDYTLSRCPYYAFEAFEALEGDAKTQLGQNLHPFVVAMLKEENSYYTMTPDLLGLCTLEDRTELQEVLHKRVQRITSGNAGFGYEKNKLRESAEKLARLLNDAWALQVLEVEDSRESILKKPLTVEQKLRRARSLARQGSTDQGAILFRELGDIDHLLEMGLRNIANAETLYKDFPDSLDSLNQKIRSIWIMIQGIRSEQESDQH